MSSKTERLGPAERAVYDLVERGAIDASHAGLYRRPLAALARVGLVRRLDSGAYQAIRAASDTRPPPASETPPARAPSEPPASTREPPMQTLVVRVPVELLEVLDTLGPNRSEAARAVLRRALGSGVRKVRAG
jgi:hypothetical protein